MLGARRARQAGHRRIGSGSSSLRKRAPGSVVGCSKAQLCCLGDGRCAENAALALFARDCLRRIASRTRITADASAAVTGRTQLSGRGMHAAPGEQAIQTCGNRAAPVQQEGKQRGRVAVGGRPGAQAGQAAVRAPAQRGGARQRRRRRLAHAGHAAQLRRAGLLQRGARARRALALRRW